jgi:hypothetical protein
MHVLVVWRYACGRKATCRLALGAVLGVEISAYMSRSNSLHVAVAVATTLANPHRKTELRLVPWLHVVLLWQGETNPAIAAVRGVVPLLVP